ncbi:MAG: tyrosine-type recombinase/integrase, partial [Acidimicrobiales bacterium]
MNSASSQQREPAGSLAAAEWDEIELTAPQLARTMRRYLAQLSTFLAPQSVNAAENVLRQFTHFLLAHSVVENVAEVSRDDVEDFKVWLASRRGSKGERLAPNTHRQRLRTLRAFFERIIEWDWPDAPARNPVIGGDIPPRPEPLPKFLDDRDAAKLMAAARASTDPRDRLVIEVLARTGMRAGELVDLEADAVVRIGEAYWLRIPIGKLRNDRYVPLHPELVELLGAWTAANVDHIRREHRLVADHRGPLDRHLIGRIVKRVGRSCEVRVHPHQLRHTLATQA